MTETSYQTQQYAVQRPVVETSYVTQNYLVQQPVTQTSYQAQNYIAYQPVTTNQTAIVNSGQYVAQNVVQPGDTTYRLRFIRGGLNTNQDTGQTAYRHGGLGWVPYQSAPSVTTQLSYQPSYSVVNVPQTSYMPQVVQQQVPVTTTTMQSQVVQQQMPVQTTRMQTEYVQQQVPVQTTRMENQVVQQQRPVVTTRMEQQLMQRQVPVQTTRYEEQVVEQQVPVQVQRMEAVVEQRKVPVSVQKQVPRRVERTKTVQRVTYEDKKYVREVRFKRRSISKRQFRNR